MEALEFESQWKRLSEILKQDIGLNREVLKRIILQKAKKQFTWIKVDSLRKTLGSTLVIILVLNKINLSFNWPQILGLIMIFLALIWVWFLEIRLLLHASRINYNQTVARTRHQILRMKQIKLRAFRIDILMSPFSLIALALLIKLDLNKLKEVNIQGAELALIGVTIGIFIASTIVYYLVSIQRRFRKLNEAFVELESLES